MSVDSMEKSEKKANFNLSKEKTAIKPADEVVQIPASSAAQPRQGSPK
jgi:hypothetical protein